MQVPADIVILITQHPLETPEQTQRAAAGTVDEACTAYCEWASRRGSEWGPWLVWVNLQRVRGKSLSEAIEELDAGGRSLLGGAAFEAGETAIGVLSYERFLQAPGEIVAYENQTLPFFYALVGAERGAEALRWTDELYARTGDAGGEQAFAALYLLSTDEVAAARVRANRMLEKNEGWPTTWAVSALVSVMEGDATRALGDAAEAAKRGLTDPALIAQLSELLGGEWERIVRENPPPERLDYDGQNQFFRDNPPLVPVPSSGPQPHWYGGTDLEMPACKGCGHQVHQWFSFDVRSIADLTDKLPSWTRVPFLGCVDCLLWMGRNDYMVDEQTRRIELTNATVPADEYGQARWRAPALERQYAELQRRPFDPDGVWAPMVGGVPYWVQDPERPDCPGCGQAMVYVGAMTGARAFRPALAMNNESGFQYHFACDACHRLSVIAQFS